MHIVTCCLVFAFLSCYSIWYSTN